MGFLKGTITFSQYRVNGELPSDFNAFFDEKIKKHAFHDSIGAAALKAIGWTDVKDPLDTDFTYTKCHFGNYLLFSMRIDKKIIPPSLFRLRYLQAEKDYLTKRDLQKIYRTQRDAIKEAVKDDLLKKIQPTPSFFEICWNPQEGTLLFSSLSEKVIDDFHGLFKEAFDCTFVPFLPWDPKHVIPEYAAQAASLEGAPWGREFLTWLWFKSEERDGMVAISQGEEAEIHFVRRLVLSSGEGDVPEQVVCQGIRSDLKEGKEALRQGKMIKEARISLSRDTLGWEFTFKADRFQFQSLKLPDAMEMEEEQEDGAKTLERIYLLEQAVSTMDQLFRLFLQVRLSPEWETEKTTHMSRWLQR